MAKARIGGKVVYYSSTSSQGTVSASGGQQLSAAVLAAQAQQPATQPTQPAQVQQPVTLTNDPTQGGVFKSTDTADYHQLYNGRNYFQSQQIGIDGQLAMQQYESANTEPGTLYSMSQNMNWALNNNIPLNANQQFVYDDLTNSMHNIGYNLTLTRYDHGDIIDKLLRQNGLSTNLNLQNMTTSQLRQSFVGMEWTENGLESTSYNNFKNSRNASTFTSREIKLTINAPANTQGLLFGKNTTSGEDLGEMLLKNGYRHRIVDAQATNTPARTKGTQSYNKHQIEFTVELY